MRINQEALGEKRIYVENSSPITSWEILIGTLRILKKLFELKREHLSRYLDFIYA